MSNAAKEAGIRKIHLELARRYADLADVSGSEIDPSQRQTALDFPVFQAALSFPPQRGGDIPHALGRLPDLRPLIGACARGRCRGSRAP
jgi:hypothetical protein